MYVFLVAVRHTGKHGVTSSAKLLSGWRFYRIGHDNVDTRIFTVSGDWDEKSADLTFNIQQQQD
jgi:hypothetical protein